MLQRHEDAKHSSGSVPLRQNEKLVWLTLFIVELLLIGKLIYQPQRRRCDYRGTVKRKI